MAITGVTNIGGDIKLERYFMPGQEIQIIAVLTMFMIFKIKERWSHQCICK